MIKKNIFVMLFLLSSCWLNIKDNSEQNEQGGQGYSSHTGLGNDPAGIDFDGDAIPLIIEQELGMSDEHPDFPIIRPVSALTKISIFKNGEQVLSTKSESKSFDKELRSRIASQILENKYGIDPNRSSYIDMSLLSSLLLLNLKLDQKMPLIEYIENDNELLAGLDIDLDLEFDGFKQLGQYENIVVSLRLLDTQSGELEDIKNFNLKNTQGGDLVIPNLGKDKFKLNVKTSIPDIFLNSDLVRQVLEGKKSFLISVSNYRYRLNSLLFEASETYNSILTKNVRFILDSGRNLNYYFIDRGIPLVSIFAKINVPYDATASGDIINILNRQSTNITTINPDLLKDDELDRASWHGYNIGERIDSYFNDENYSGFLYFRNIDLIKGLNQSFEIEKSGDNEGSVRIFREDKIFMTIEKVEMAASYEEETYTVPGRGKRCWCAIRHEPRPDREPRGKERIACSDHEYVACETYPTACVGIDRNFSGVEERPVPIVRDDFKFIFIQKNNEKISVLDLVDSGKAYISSDKMKLYIELINDTKKEMFLKFYTEKKRDLVFNNGHVGYRGACDIDHFAETRPASIIEKKDAIFSGFRFNAVINGMTRLDR